MDEIVRETRLTREVISWQLHRSDSKYSRHGAGGGRNRAMGLRDIPYYVVGPFIRFRGVDIEKGVWKGSALVLVRTNWDGSLISPHVVFEDSGEEESLNHSGGKSFFDRFSSKHRHKHYRDSKDGHSSVARNPSKDSVLGHLAESKLKEMNMDKSAPGPAGAFSRFPPSRSDSAATSSGQSSFGTFSSVPRNGTIFSNKPSLRPVLILKETLYTTSADNPPATSASSATLPETEAAPSDDAWVRTGQAGERAVEPELLEMNLFGFSVWRFDLTVDQDATNTKKVRYRMVFPEAQSKLRPKDIGEHRPGPMRIFEDGDELEFHDWKNWASFHVPGRDTRVRAAFFTCNGFEIYNDDIFNFPEQPINRWMNLPGKLERETAPWTQEMEEFARGFYFRNYCMHFLTSPFEDALRSIPYIFTCDDHDLFDGFGSYPDSLQNSPVFQGIGRVAFRNYLLFQQHTTIPRARDDGFFPVNPTPDGRFATGFNLVVRLSARVVLVAVDSRSERSKEKVFKDDSWALVRNAMEYEGRVGMEHLLFVNPVPMIFGDIGSVEGIMEWMSNALNSNTWLHRVVDKLGLWRLETLKFGEPQFLDDCVDHWTSKLHIVERNVILRDLATFAKMNSARVTVLAGDVHCAGVGRLRSQGVKTRDQEASDHKTIYQLICSAICNDPPPAVVVNWMFEGTDRPPRGVFTHKNKNGRVVHLPGDEIVVGRVQEGLVRFRELQKIWSEEVHGSRRSWGAKAGSGTGDKIGFRDKAHLKRVGKRKLLRHRNWCEITELPALSVAPENPYVPVVGADPTYVPAEETPRHLPGRVEFILHCERAREYKRLKQRLSKGMKRDPKQWALQMSALQQDRINQTGDYYPETNIYGLVVPGLLPSYRPLTVPRQMLRPATSLSHVTSGTQETANGSTVGLVPHTPPHT
ncbi:hypothetical protein M427DRAFT_33063 [Gonapodya prolifera JEL478]|uniref:PhoD-like phosphatase domain-containing protein n=1 Tax=Gonapodya prolifera (strain JEL478) TaxID=1344416 RepID=A0A139ACZ9_GONPJ|nr:hypothetical protein M427DRAFT_33063 [Gonapodya prolifera JEL478]|eukprot:KXS14628.1 hypothetical protein M427DRAFT_33063 [Gonapodya prolifera JEL478]